MGREELMRIAIVALVGLGLTGCAQHQQSAGAPMAPNPTSFSQVQRECGGSAKPFVETWGCVSVGMAGMDLYPDIQAVFVATGNFVAAQVTEGKMTDAEAKVVMAKARQTAYEDSSVRDDRDHPRRTASAPQAVNSPAMPIFPPAPMPDYSTPTTGWGSPPQIIYTPRGGIMCQRLGPTSVMCN